MLGCVTDVLLQGRGRNSTNSQEFCEGSAGGKELYRAKQLVKKTWIKKINLKSLE